MKLLPLGLLATLGASSAVGAKEEEKPTKKETIGFKFASAEVPEYFYEFKVILTVFADKIFKDTGFMLTAIQPAKNRVRLQFSNQQQQEVTVFVVPNGIEEAQPFYQGKYVELLYSLGSKSSAKNNDKLATLLKNGKLLPTLSYYIDNYIETKLTKNLV